MPEKTLTFNCENLSQHIHKYFFKLIVLLQTFLHEIHLIYILAVH